MSKMSQLHAELTQQAVELGFKNIEEAEQAGYGVDLLNAKLTPPEEEAHKAWLKEKEETIRRLELTLENVDLDDVDNVQNAIDFIRGIKYDA